MPRIAKPISPEVQRVQKLVRTCLATNGITETALAEATGVRQYTVSRVLTGRLKNMTGDALKLEIYAKKAMQNARLEPSKHPGERAAGASDMAWARLRAAVEEAWDGSVAGAALLADVLQAMGPVVRRHAKDQGGI